MTAVIILAAGASTRLGTPKQLLAYNHKTLLRHAIDEALAAGAAPVVVVIGAHADAIKPAITDAGILVAENPDWENGMGAGIRTGMAAIAQAAPGAENVLLMLCDQPFADRALLQSMIAHKSVTGKGIVACAYSGTVGAPVLFDKRYFDDLLALPDSGGAKALLSRYGSDVAPIPFPGGATDIDTAADYYAQFR